MSNDKPNQLYAMRHSAAHVLATAILRKWPKVQFGVGPVVDNGFYYDVLLPDGQKISEEDLKSIEKQMKKIIAGNQEFVQTSMPIDKAIEWARDNKQPFKEELLNDLQRSGTTVAKDLSSEEMGSVVGGEGVVDEVGFYTNGDFTDLCRGPHVKNTSEIGAFKLTKLAGAYWRGDENNPQLQRIYGVAFTTQKELDEYFIQQEKAQQNDHRKLGKELQLFFTTEEVGKGLPLMMPRGETIKDLLMRYMRQEEKERDYQYVSTPVLTQEALYQQSGHAEFYAEDMYRTVADEEGNSFFVKPMNCPHHHMIYRQMVNSYRDLPLRLAEGAGLYRYELSGTLTGLIRMRGPITQNDSHTYVTKDQLRDELMNLMNFFAETYKQFQFDDYWYRLSLPDFSKGKFSGDKQQWEYAAKLIEEVLDELQVDYVKEEGEAAFYGPKIDVQTTNVNGKEDSIATMQIDVLVPHRMGITYVDSNSEEQHPYIIHKSIMGAYERFLGFLLEKTGGHLPFWLAPEQIRILTINDSVSEYVDKITTVLSDTILMEPLRYNEIRYSVDDRHLSLGKKISEARNMRTPVILIVGPRDAEQNTISVRQGDEEQSIPFDELQIFLQQIDN